MSTIVIKNCPIALDRTIAAKIDLDGSGLDRYCFIKLDATCTFAIGSDSMLGSFVNGLDENAIREHDAFKMTVKLFSNGIEEAILDFNSEAPFTKDALGAEFAALASRAAENANARYADQYQSSIGDIRFSSVTFYESDDTTVVYKWEDAAGGQWTCEYCGSAVSGNFCCNCGAPRS